MKEMILQKIIETMKKPAIAWIFTALIAAVATFSGLKQSEVKDLACAVNAPAIEIKK